MPTGYWAAVTLHILAAFAWLGGMLFLGVVGAPVLRSVEPPALRQRLFQQLGLRFRTVGWAAIAVLVATGIVNLYYRGWLHWSGALGEPAFWRTGVGHALAVKVGAVAVMIVVSALHDFVLGPAAGRAAPGTPRAIALRRRAALLARANALVGSPQRLRCLAPYWARRQLMALNAVAPNKKPNVATMGPPSRNAESIRSTDSTAISTPPPNPMTVATMRCGSRPPKATATTAPSRSPEAASSPQHAACANIGNVILLSVFAPVFPARAGRDARPGGRGLRLPSRSIGAGRGRIHGPAA
jgi:copper resistance protein D